jgi:hypothetical protein
MQGRMMGKKRSNRKKRRLNGCYKGTILRWESKVDGRQIPLIGNGNVFGMWIKTAPAQWEQLADRGAALG